MNVNEIISIIISLVANLIVLKDNNPDNPQTAPRSASVTYIRPKNVAFFQSMWLTILSGIKPCAGLGKANEPRVQPSTKKERCQ